MGVTPEEIFLGVFSKAADPASGGRQMPNHWSEPNLNIFTASSVIATQYPHACGIAYQLKMEGRPGVVLSQLGRRRHLRRRLARGDELRRDPPTPGHLPDREQPVRHIGAPRPRSGRQRGGPGRRLRHPGVTIDGNDVLGVYGTVAAAVERARAGGGPSLIEAMTYRYYAHTSDDDDKLYRTAEEVELVAPQGPHHHPPAVPGRVTLARRDNGANHR